MTAQTEVEMIAKGVIASLSKHSQIPTFSSRPGGHGIDEATAELVAIADLDEPRIVFCAVVPEGNQLLKHDRTFTPFGVPSE
jgi:hypothetical protein